MITRSFLFLLALFTGLSAAEAANASHSAPTSVGATVASDAAPVSGLDYADQLKMIAGISVTPARCAALSAEKPRGYADHQVAASARIFRGERSQI